MNAAHGGGHGLGFPWLAPIRNLLRVTGPLLSLVLRTEDVWQRYNQYTETFRGSQSGFPLLTPTMQAGQGSNAGGWLRGNVYAASSDSGGFGTRRPSNQEAFREVASRGPLSFFIILI